MIERCPGYNSLQGCWDFCIGRFLRQLLGFSILEVINQVLFWCSMRRILEQALVSVVAIYIVMVGFDEDVSKSKHIGYKGPKPSDVKWLEYVKSWLKPVTTRLTPAFTSIKATAFLIRGRLFDWLESATTPDMVEHIRKRRKIRQAVESRRVPVSKERWIKSKLSANICMFTYLLSRWGPTHSSYGVLQTNDSLFGHANWVLLAAVASLKGDGEPAFNPDGRQETFDASSYPVGIDNRASSCLSSNLPDFVPGTMKPSKRVVRTYNGHLMGGLQEGTIKWSVQDDLGGQHDWLLPKSHYVPGNGTSRLLSPQHWAQCMPRRWKATCDTGADDMTLKWEDHQAVPHTITCPLDPWTNVSNLYAHTTGADEDFGLFIHEAELEDEDNPYCMACSSPFDTGATAVVTDDEWDVSDTESDLNHADVDLDGWDGDSEFTWGEGDGDTITTAASTAADSLNSEGSSHYEGAHFGESPLTSLRTAPRLKEWWIGMRRRSSSQASPPSSCGFIIDSTTSPSARSR